MTRRGTFGRAAKLALFPKLLRTHAIIAVEGESRDANGDTKGTSREHEGSRKGRLREPAEQSRLQRAAGWRLVSDVPHMVHSVGSEKPVKRVPAIFYRTEAGGEVREWLKSSPTREDRRLIGNDIETVECGWPIGMPVCWPLEGGICEVRTNLPQNRIARVLFYIDKLS